MNRDDVRNLLGLITTLDDSRRFAAPDIDGWHMVLADLDPDEARQAVVRHYASRVTAIKPAHIRRHVAQANGKLAPSIDQAWHGIVTVAGNDGQDASKLHPAVSETYFALGGSPAIRTQPEGVVRAQFRDLYGPIAERFDQWAIGSGIPGLPIEGMRSTPALLPSDRVRDPDAEPARGPSDPQATAALIEQTREELRRLSVKRDPMPDPAAPADPAPAS